MSDFRPAPKPQPRERKEKKPPRAKNLARSADTYTRCYHSQERVEFIQSLPCIVTGCVKPSENMHIEGDGASRKANYDKIVPCCKGHHTTRTDSLHQLGREEFEGTHMVDLAALSLDAERTWRRFAGNLPSEPVVMPSEKIETLTDGEDA